MSSKPVALKEWASAVKALGEGTQIFVLRKGGIAEETREFRLRSPFFYFYPGYEHQRAELVKEEYRAYVDQTREEWVPGKPEIPITCCAEVKEDIEIFDEHELERLAGFHIWTDRFAYDRLKWKKKQPLHLLLLKVYRLEPAIRIEVRPEYSGCTSWIELKADLAAARLMPVLEEDELAKRIREVKDALGRDANRRG